MILHVIQVKKVIVSMQKTTMIVMVIVLQQKIVMVTVVELQNMMSAEYVKVIIAVVKTAQVFQMEML